MRASRKKIFVAAFLAATAVVASAAEPMFMVTVLNANALTVGLVDGVGEATALVAKVFSGPLGD